MTLLAMLILVLFIFLSAASGRSLLSKFHKLMPRKVAYKITAIYCALGLAAFLYIQFGNVQHVEKLDDEQEELLQDESGPVLPLLYANRADDINEAFVRDRKTITTDEQELYLSTMSEHSVRGVISYREDATSNEIKMTVYNVSTIFDGYDVTDYLYPVNLDIVEGRLYVTSQPKYLRIYEVYGKILTVDQETDPNGYYALNGTNVVHLSVPSHIQVHKDGLDFDIFD